MNPAPVSLLIVDDDPVSAQFVRQLVLSLGGEFPCMPQWAESAEAALGELGQRAYELMLLDYNLPGANGLQLLAQIRDLPAERQPAVIMLTGSGSERVAVEAMKRGARDYLPKEGLDAALLLRALRSALAQKQLADQVARYHAQTRADLEMARHLQQSLLPDSYPCFPRSAAPSESRLRFCHRFSPASELAGDFFSVLPLSDTRAGVFICDVMGHGVRSALVTAMVRGLLENAARRAANPGRFLSEMNHRLGSLLKPASSPMFVTAFYLVADVAAGRLSYATAGHPPPLRLRRGTGQAAPLPVPSRAGAALGLFGDAAYVTSECPLVPGDVILLFTDGLFEVMSADTQEEYGRQRLLAAARQQIKLPLPDLCDALIAGVRAFAGEAALSDDMCLLGVEVTERKITRKEATP
ncbi:MAG TPA: fused response regulator/phosphatase [Candidatus Paceibacterota bacterium]|nr:fused response regulator/phosphatase [Verrucomicrobiota bacterium]HSA11615.1 fused response regulator/phosphatase [Candidatus Paceibacterota bacterium]